MAGSAQPGDPAPTLASGNGCQRGIGLPASPQGNDTLHLPSASSGITARRATESRLPSEPPLAETPGAWQRQGPSPGTRSPGRSPCGYTASTRPRWLQWHRGGQQALWQAPATPAAGAQLPGPASGEAGHAASLCSLHQIISYLQALPPRQPPLTSLARPQRLETTAADVWLLHTARHTGTAAPAGETPHPRPQKALS